jgi:tRNA (guanosine-2'-O-)-methyltransferase
MESTRQERIKQVVQNRLAHVVVILEDIHDPHNAAAILRTCDGLGIQDIYVIFEKETPYNPKKVGKASSSSANKWLDFTVFSSTKECLEKLKTDGYTISVTALSDKAESLLTVQFTEEKIAILVGNEHRGASDTAIRMADRVIMIPMAGFVQSYNVSVATAIVLWEACKQRRESGNWSLSEQAQQTLENDFLSRGKKKAVTAKD